MGRRDRWLRAHEIERLTQLRADVDSAMGRLMTECVRRSTQVPAEQAGEWLRRAEWIEDLRSWALEDIDQWLTDLGTEVT